MMTLKIEQKPFKQTRALYNRGGSWYMTDASLLMNGKVEMMEFPIKNVRENYLLDLFGLPVGKVNWSRGTIVHLCPLDKWDDDTFAEVLIEMGIQSAAIMSVEREFEVIEGIDNDIY